MMQEVESQKNKCTCVQCESWYAQIKDAVCDCQQQMNRESAADSNKVWNDKKNLD